MKKTLALLTIGTTLLANTSFASFKDINTNDWYYDAVQYVSENNILNGTGEDLFSPSENMTRAMIVQALYNMEEKPEVEGANVYFSLTKDGIAVNPEELMQKCKKETVSGPGAYIS